MKALYCITAINRLTKEREKISCASTSKDTLESIKVGFLRTPAKRRTHIYPVIQVMQTKLF